MQRAAGGIRSSLGAEAAWWGDDVVATRSGGLSAGSRGYNWRALYPIHFRLVNLV